MDLRAYLIECAQRVDAELERWLPPAAEAPANLHAAMRHLIFPGGKRLRPALAFAGAEAVGAAPECALPVAAAVELVHTYSLVHDDLPCMDDDDERRGRPTVHVLYGEAVAVLAGDALLAAAFELLADASTRAEPARTLAVLRDLAHAAGSRQLVGGQADDLSFSRDTADGTLVESVHQRKTAALFEAAVVGGARLGGADGDALARLRGFARRIGIAFQIADDALDADSDEACSLVRVIGVAASRERAERLQREAIDALEAFGAPAEPLREIARFTVGRTQ
jgi:geranylgeranyl pyrophosphate synthase